VAFLEAEQQLFTHIPPSIPFHLLLHLPPFLVIASLSSNILAQNTHLSDLEVYRKLLSAMYFLDRYRKILASVPLFFLSLTLAQDTAFQTIYSLDIYSSQKPCAQQCFIYTGLGCHEDAVASAIGCQHSACDVNYGAPNNCYCRSDLQSAAESYITSCVKSGCTVGDSSIDISSAGSIYNYYCSSIGFPVNVPATTTQGSVQATTTVYVTVYGSGGVLTGGLAYSTVEKIWGLLSIILVHI
jgi:hypothetical protein